MALAADHQVVVDGDAQRSRRVLLGHGASLRTSVLLSLVLLACDFREWKPAEITRYRGQPIEAPQDGLVDTLSPRAFDSIINVVLHGTAYCTLAAGQRWIEGKHAGTILSILTSSAWQGRAFMVPSANRQGWCAFHGAELGYRMGSQGNPHCHGRPWTLSYRRRVGEARPGLSRIRSAGRARPCMASGTAR
jgi:hypothetical protein